MNGQNVCRHRQTHQRTVVASIGLFEKPIAISVDHEIRDIELIRDPASAAIRSPNIIATAVRGCTVGSRLIIIVSVWCLLLVLLLLLLLVLVLLLWWQRRGQLVTEGQSWNIKEVKDIEILELVGSGGAGRRDARYAAGGTREVARLSADEEVEVERGPPHIGQNSDRGGRDALARVAHGAFAIAVLVENALQEFAVPRRNGPVASHLAQRVDEKPNLRR